MTVPDARVVERHVEHVEVTGLEPFVRELVELQTNVVMAVLVCLALATASLVLMAVRAATRAKT